MLFKKEKFKHSESMGIAYLMGVHLVSGVIVGIVIGYYLDKYFETKPWLTLVFLVLGIIAGYRNLFREMKRIQRIEAKADARESEEKD